MIYELLWYFTIYAFLGWIVEVSFHTVTKGNFVNRGFLNGPVCPIYGFGMLAVILVLEPLANNLTVLFIGSIILTTLLELVTGFVLEKLFHTRWWDYSENRFNIGGYVCLQYSILWGIACVAIIKLIQPMMENFVAWIPHTLGIILISIVMLCFLADFIVMVVTLTKLNTEIKLARSLSSELHKASDKLGRDISDEVIVVRRLLNAYPNLKKRYENKLRNRKNS